MARFDVYTSSSGATGYLLDTQADMLGALNTRVVVPLLPLDVAPTPAQHLNPRLAVGGEPVVMVTQFMAAVPTAELKGPVGSLGHERDAILAAIDFLHQGW